MIHIYTVTGMTCNGCRTSVEDKLNAIDGVLNANSKFGKSGGNYRNVSTIFR